MQNITPSTRPLMQFVSPNASFLGRIISVSGSQLAPLVNNNAQLNLWEDQEICGLAVHNLENDAECLQSLRQIKSVLSCPLLIASHVQHVTDLYRLREIDADAVITPITTLMQNDLQGLQQKAQAMNLLMIFHIQSENDWQKIADLKPRFIFVENSFDFLQMMPSQTWLIGSADFTDCTKLKCRLEPVI